MKGKWTAYVAAGIVAAGILREAGREPLLR